MNKDTESRKEIIKLLATKSVTKYETFDNTAIVFEQIKSSLKELASQVKSELKELGKNIPVEYQERGKFEVEFKVAGDLLLFYMHTNIFEFPKSHAVVQQSYLKEDPTRSYCGVISVYNFLADSFKYNRINDVGYLVSRIFINKDNHFLLEGKKQLGFMFNNFSTQKMNNDSLQKILEAALAYSIELDLLVPTFNSVSIVSVAEMQDITSSMALKTGKPLGFRYKVGK
ncbi:MAG: hypothetical protein DRI86_07545 [Bacteroidetes bacterium]|nr:MAG: hypothetical protein DRI86_07545 [Bacteroidota bacterium]